jgi:hypothetical protein
MQWFKHDSDAATDAKVKKLIIRYGPVGYAIYFHCLELIMGDIGETNITFELEHDSEIIADDLRIQGTSDKSAMAIVEEVMRYIVDLRLFDEVDGHIFCYKLLKRLDLSMTSNQKLRAMITEAKSSHDIVMMRHDTVMHEEKRGEEKREEKRRGDEREAGASPVPPSFRIGSDGTSRFERIKASSIGFPPIRKNFLELRDDDRREILATLSHYTDEEICEAMKTYADILKDEKYEIFAPYASLIGFLRSGVEKFVNESNPREVYLKRDPETLEKARRDAFFDSLKNKTDEGGEDDE